MNGAFFCAPGDEADTGGADDPFAVDLQPLDAGTGPSFKPVIFIVSRERADPEPQFEPRLAALVVLTVTCEVKGAVLRRFLDCHGLLPELPSEWALPKFPQLPGRSAIKRMRLIKRSLRHEPEELQAALLSAAVYELVDRLSIDDDYSVRESMQALLERCELIEFMRRQGINRSSFTDEVMRVEWLSHAERMRALRNRQWFYKRKARFQAVMRRSNWPVKYWT